MTPPPKDEEGSVVEIDAMDETEWEQDQHTPVASDTKLEELRRKMVPTPAVAMPVVGGEKVPTFARTTTRTPTVATPPPTPKPIVKPHATPPPTKVSTEAVQASTSAKLKSITTTKVPKVGSTTGSAPIVKKPIVSIPPKAQSTGTPLPMQDSQVDSGPTTTVRGEPPPDKVATPKSRPVASKPVASKPVASRPATPPSGLDVTPAPLAPPVVAPPVVAPPVVAPPRLAEASAAMAPTSANLILEPEKLVEPATIIEPAKLEPAKLESVEDAVVIAPPLRAPSIEAAPLPPPPAPLPPAPMSAQPVITRAPARELAVGSTALPHAFLDQSATPIAPPQLTAEQREQYRPDTASSLAAHNAVTQSDHDASSRLVAEPPSKRKRVPFVVLFGGAAAAMVIVAVVIFATRGGDKADDTKPMPAQARTPAPEKVATSEPAATDPDEPTATETASEPGASDVKRTPPSTKPPTPIDPPATGSGSAVEVAAVTPPPVETATATVAPTPPKPAPVKKLGGKKVVLEYDTAAPKDTKTVSAKGDETAAIAAARITYFNGNKKLFAGDAAAAIKLYQQALGVYPGYVAGYRGLGLAYAQKGDKPAALKAFRTYLAAVPNAKDAGLIRKRIQSLR